MNKIIFRLIFCLVAALTLSACNKNSDSPSPIIPPDVRYDYVTLVTTGKSSTTFSMQVSAESELLTFVANTSLADIQTLKAGDRLIIAYKPIDGIGSELKSGQINLYGYRLLNSTEQLLQTPNQDDFAQMLSVPVEMNTLFRTGQYINTQLEIYGQRAVDPSKFILVLDPSTYNDEYPSLELFIEPGPDNVGENRFTYYGSFDISQLWNRQSCKGVRISYVTRQGVRTETFSRGGQETIQPGEPDKPTN